jgi:PQQ-dependent catabolism-associated CXXCW motif protein
MAARPLHRRPTHENLPGSHWLANTGDGDLTPPWQDYFARHLQQLTAGNLTRPLVFYCRSDCWLSWNAVKRAASMGYKTLYCRRSPAVSQSHS